MVVKHRINSEGNNEISNNKTVPQMSEKQYDHSIYDHCQLNQQVPEWL